MEISLRPQPGVKIQILRLPGPLRRPIEGRVFMYPIWHIHGPPHQLGQRKRIEAQYLIKT